MHLAVIFGDLQQQKIPYVRVHIGHPLRDWLGVLSTDRIASRSSWILPMALKFLGQHQGILVLIDQTTLSVGETRRAWQSLVTVEALSSANEEAASATVATHSSETAVTQLAANAAEAECATTPSYRTIGTGSQILRALGVRQMRLLSSKLKFNALSGFGLEIVEYIEPQRY
jgi:3,4-dihydroxy 2-butanone 4-phosphate synthase / GTP cyclohydrolase II